MSGATAAPNIPRALITTSASTTSASSPTVSRQTASVSFQRAAWTSVPSRRCGPSPNRSTHSSRYALISGWRAYARDHAGLGANEKEYRCDLMSHSAPG